ncbi:hypothetical protein [Methylibium petroleiphilum]|jgi:hypothetical protein|uniref:hypothetical protein n=1 Tax=Methylibium petroleiphilum TaxID=105560 RepID=UPI001AC2F221|nr:hypothetical protein [Methylibium petroleiphilum]MBN9203519.1 hypothetical protein [Methylibium petroleiphilum]MCZ8109845.1 hypothetical protein [Rubrivivax sp.]
MNTALASVHPARATGSLATDGIDDPGTAHFAGSRRSKRLLSLVSLFVLMALGLSVAFPGYALDLVAFTGITGPLTSALTQIASLGPGIKALVGFVGFVVALISLAALRNFGPVLFYVGLAIFAAVGLVIAGAIMGAVI